MTLAPFTGGLTVSLGLLIGETSFGTLASHSSSSSDNLFELLEYHEPA